MQHLPRLVIIGGGFAGLQLAKKINRRMYDVVVIDRNNYHSFPPLFYQVASAGLDSSNISFPLRRQFYNALDNKNISYHMGDVRTIDVANKEVETQFQHIPYDILVVAAGTTNNFFNMPQLQQYVYTLKSTSEALRCRNAIIERMERASITDDSDERRRLLSFVVVGGGPSGVEMAGAIGEMKKYVLPREYPQIPAEDMSITLLEGTDKLLRTMSPFASAKARVYLESLMVKVRTSTTMKDYDGSVITLADGETLQSTMVIWTAGIRGESFKWTGADIEPGHGDRLVVDQYNKLAGVDDVYVLGDLSLMTTDEYPHGHPQVAQVAIQQASNLAYNLNHIGIPMRPFKYKDKGTMATVGRNRAVADVAGLHIGGKLAWFTWMLVHLMAILGARKKMLILINWIGAYFTYSSAVRLIIRPTKYPRRTYI